MSTVLLSNNTIHSKSINEYKFSSLAVIAIKIVIEIVRETYFHSIFVNPWQHLVNFSIEHCNLYVLKELMPPKIAIVQCDIIKKTVFTNNGLVAKCIMCRIKVTHRLCYLSIYAWTFRIINTIINYNGKINCKTECKYTRISTLFLSIVPTGSVAIFINKNWCAHYFTSISIYLLARVLPRLIIVGFIAIFIGW